MTATTIEQSRRLLELGLDPESADMTYLLFSDGKYSIKVEIGERQKGESFLPAWSLSALLEVMSKVRCISYLTIDSSYLVRCKDLGFLWQKDIASKDPITAAYEMVCWLLKQGLIEKGGEE